MVAIGKRALVVARSGLNGGEVTSALEQLGCSVDAASRGLDALRLLGMQCPYDLIVTELLLDGINGLALIIIAKKKNPSVRTVAVNNGNQTLRLFAMESGVDEVLDLPLDSEKVHETVRLFLEENGSKDCSGNESRDSRVWL
jgi:CheY-like chemotaxis protein